MRLYSFDDSSWNLKVDTVLRPKVMYVDVVSIGGTERLISFEPGRVNWFDSESRLELKLQSVSVSYRSNRQDELPQVDVTWDLNGDSREDLIIPDFDGFWVSLQLRDGSFSDSVELGPPEPFLGESPIDHSHTYREMGINPQTIPWLLSRVHQMDYDQDGDRDLVFWNEDHFEVHRQKANGRFSSTSEWFTSDVLFDSDGAYSLMFGYGDVSNFSLVFGTRKSSERTVLQSVRDMNGDGVADLVTHSLKGRSVLKQPSRYAVHLGKASPEGITFEKKSSTVIHPQGKAGAMQASGYSTFALHDFDRDGQVDIILSQIRTGIGGMARALVGNSVSLDLEVYRMEKGRYPAKPTFRRQIKPSFRPFSGRDVMFFPAALVGDVTGDGRLDLLVGKSWGELSESITTFDTWE